MRLGDISGCGNRFAAASSRVFLMSCFCVALGRQHLSRLLLTETVRGCCVVLVCNCVIVFSRLCSASSREACASGFPLMCVGLPLSACCAYSADTLFHVTTYCVMIFPHLALENELLTCVGDMKSYKCEPKKYEIAV